MLQILVKLLVILPVCAGRKGVGPGDQEWGSFQIRPNAQLFWWLYRTTSRNESRPLAMWLQGGPGCASTGLGNFVEIGPLDVDLEPRKHAWTKLMNVVFVDSPVGTGFSEVSDPKAFTTTNEMIALDLVVFCEQFFSKFEEFKGTPLYVFGESYGGKMAIEFVLNLDRQISKNNKLRNIDLKGVVFIDAWISPIDHMSLYGSFLYYSGRIDKPTFKKIERETSYVLMILQLKMYASAADKWQVLLNTISSLTNNINVYNVDEQDPTKATDTKKKLADLMNTRVSKKLRIPNYFNPQHWAVTNYTVFDCLKDDFMKPAINIVDKVLQETELKVVVISGDQDLIVPAAGTVRWVDKLKWLQKKERVWYDTRRQVFEVSFEKFRLAQGYRKRAGNRLVIYWIKNSGHMVPKDNPIAMMGILRDEIIDD